MHECPECGEACSCDGEDHHQSALDDCSHYCNNTNDPVAAGLDCDDDDEDGYDAADTGACEHGVSLNLACPYCDA